MQTVQRGSTSETVSSQLTACVALVDQALHNARALALNLRPPLLDDLGRDLRLPRRQVAHARLLAAQMHVHDGGTGIEGITRLLFSNVHEPVNIGNPREFTINQFAKLVLKLSPTKSKIIYKPLPVDDPKQRRPDISRARKYLQWTPQVNLEQGLRETINWFKIHGEV